MICPQEVTRTYREDDDGFRKRLHLGQKETAIGVEILRRRRDVEI
jgi:hypothetical protein